MYQLKIKFLSLITGLIATNWDFVFHSSPREVESRTDQKILFFLFYFGGFFLASSPSLRLQLRQDTHGKYTRGQLGVKCNI